VFEAKPLYHNRLNKPSSIWSWITPHSRLYACIIIINRRNVSFVFTAVRCRPAPVVYTFILLLLYYCVYLHIFYYNITCDSDEGPAAELWLMKPETSGQSRYDGAPLYSCLHLIIMQLAHEDELIKAVYTRRTQNNGSISGEMHLTLVFYYTSFYSIFVFILRK